MLLQWVLALPSLVPSVECADVIQVGGLCLDGALVVLVRMAAVRFAVELLHVACSSRFWGRPWRVLVARLGVELLQRDRCVQRLLLINDVRIYQLNVLHDLGELSPAHVEVALAVELVGPHIQGPLVLVKGA